MPGFPGFRQVQPEAVGTAREKEEDSVGDTSPARAAVVGARDAAAQQALAHPAPRQSKRGGGARETHDLLKVLASLLPVPEAEHHWLGRAGLGAACGEGNFEQIEKEDRDVIGRKR